MFTGIVEGIGQVVARKSTPLSTRLTVDVAGLADGVKLGDSISHNGCCLTVVDIDRSHLGFDLLKETEARTNLRAAQMGDWINLERALAANGRYGGHFVTGHIDGVGSIRSWKKIGPDFELRIAMTPGSGKYLVPKGCIAVDGISLTVAEVLDDEFSVWIIPHTRQVTALQFRRVGDALNLEFDLLAKYTEKILAARS